MIARITHRQRDGHRLHPRGRALAGRHRGAGHRLGELEDLAGRGRAGGGHEDVARARGEEVRDVEAAGAAHQRRHALLEQHALQRARPRTGCARRRPSRAGPRRTAGGSCGRARGGRRPGPAPPPRRRPAGRRSARRTAPRPRAPSRRRGRRALGDDLQLGPATWPSTIRQARTSGSPSSSAHDHVQRVGIEREVGCPSARARAPWPGASGRSHRGRGPPPRSPADVVLLLPSIT